MDTSKYLLIALAIFFSPLSNATAILKTDLGVAAATVGSAYPTLPGSPDYSEHIVSQVLDSDFSSDGYSSTPYPNYGWVSWSTSDQYLSFRAGQDYCFDCGYDDSGYGYSSLDFFWVFSVEGDGGALMQDLYSGTGSVQSMLIDITDPSNKVDLSAAPGFNYTGDQYDLLDDHRYLIYASLDNQALADGFEAEYYISLENAFISIAEPEMALLMLIGLGLVVTARRRDIKGLPA
jgi:hypothetical protein